MRVLKSLCQGRVTGVDFGPGLLAQARSAYPDASWVRAKSGRAVRVATTSRLHLAAGPPR